MPGAEGDNYDDFALDSEPPIRERRIDRGTGWVRDSHDPRDLKARALFGARRGLANESMELEGCVPGILSQGMASACVGYAIGTAIDARLRKLGRWDAPITSKRGIYDVGRVLDRVSPDDLLPDEGCQPRFAMRGIREWGVATEDRWPSPALETITESPPLDVLMQASSAKLDAWWRIDSTARERVEDICQALAAGYPVVFGTDVDQAFMDYSGKRPVGPHNPKDTQGGHMLLFVGYTTTNGARVLRGVNSWGIDWGDKGFFWASEAFVMDEAFGDVYVLQVSGG